jgi:hemerythrin superfamily protein
MPRKRVNINRARSEAMARSKAKGKSRAASGAKRAGGARGRNGGNGSGRDAIALLKADHREVEGWFTELQKTRTEKRKLGLTQQICTALKVHATIEEELFYPAYLEATADKAKHHEAAVEHDGVKTLIAQIESAGPGDDFHDARMTVLAELVKHHVKEEEQGMFPEARGAHMELKALGEALLARKRQLMTEGVRPPRHGRAERGMPLHA